LTTPNGKAEMVTYMWLPAILLNSVRSKLALDQRMARQLAQRMLRSRRYNGSSPRLQRNIDEVERWPSVSNQRARTAGPEATNPRALGKHHSS